MIQPARRHAWAYPAMLAVFFVFLFSSCQKTPELTKSDEAITDEMMLARNSDRNKGVDVRVVADGIASPLGVVAVPDDDDHGRGGHGKHDDWKHFRKSDKRLFIIDQVGKIWILDAKGNRLPEPFLDITSRLIPLNPNGDERGLLGFAFHPNYKKNGRFFVYYNAPPRPGGPDSIRSWNNLSRISEFRVSSNPNRANMTSERPLIELDDPQGNHNGGTIAFGPDDGYLYIAIGDGGGANDVGPGHVEDWYPVNAGGMDRMWKPIFSEIF